MALKASFNELSEGFIGNVLFQVLRENTRSEFEYF